MSEIGEMVYKDLIARGRTVGVAREWRSLVKVFVEAVGEKKGYKRGDVIKYLYLVRNKYHHKESTIRKDLRAVKLLAKIQEWDFPKLDLPKVRRDDVKRTIFSKDEVLEIIRGCREKLNKRQQAFFFLSTIYGMRRGELGHLDEREVRDGLQITVNTLKGGIKTTHCVPAGLGYVLEEYKGAGREYLTDVFEDAMKKLGMRERGGGWGWHSIRRALVTELLMNEVSLLNIVRFMRWSEERMGKEFGMLAIYAKKDQGRVDNEVFKLHPFLEAWRGWVHDRG